MFDAAPRETDAFENAASRDESTHADATHCHDHTGGNCLPDLIGAVLVVSRQFLPTCIDTEGKGDADEDINEHKKPVVGGGEHVGMTAETVPGKTIPGNLHHAGDFERHEVESKDVERAVADIDQSFLRPTAPLVEQACRADQDEEAANSRKRKGDEALEIGTPRHGGGSEDGANDKHRQTTDIDPPLLGEVILTNQKTARHEEHAHQFSVAALRNAGEIHAAAHFPKEQDENQNGHAPPYLQRCLDLRQFLQQLEENQEADRGEQQGTEKPEGTTEELVVTGHVEHDARQMLTELREIVGMGHAASGVAVGLAEDAQRKKEVVHDEEEDAPAEIREIESADATHDEGALVFQIACVKEVAGADEEHRHVEKIYKILHPACSAGMGEHDADDGECFDD